MRAAMNGAHKLSLEEAQTSWFVRQGGDCSAVRIGESACGRGLFAARSIRAGEQIVRIPHDLVLTAEKLDDCVKKLLSTEYDWCPLTLLILAEQHKGEASRWAPYVSCLPSFGDHHSTIFWEKEELKFLECTRAFRGTAERREMISDEYISVKNVISSCPHVFGEDISLFQFAHAYATVVSRAWNGALSSEISMRPFVDFCNHDPVSHATVSHDSCKDATVIIAERDYTKGEEVFISYGKRSNAVLAVDYGFVLPNNLSDQAELWMEIPWNDPLREKKLELMGAFNMPTLQNADGTESGELPVILEEVLDSADWEDGVVLPQARAFSRIICLDSLEDIQSMIQESDTLQAPLAYQPRKDVAKETRAMNFLLEMIQESITSHEQALLMLQSAPDHVNKIRRGMAEAVLDGELRVLENSRGWLKDCLPNGQEQA
ncbi:fructose-bisphosphate aldolase-lysine N-methyltransferase, chloroplastic isoform X1 [Selaginella moellendorffii]|uniref:fructose-bisphosphate aldolase-lysine N-methyltransferase, chloroplastic isoform X1 n=1 Tax=Selaginella moellendorffii TaxID=88036 RepID=UPI000D1C7AC5|nr:fructose-bisphosphate aldolase-lysine N-methyltransferase, chloroplastic isoform X1 [Selaginella moellendorffii]|eukprot:XP_024521282.1 fructose-bisphosphate aldolase-lysine N-methyltransferase, chloroplastic isoform X1 [Selaginella moellendorffii]